MADRRQYHRGDVVVHPRRPEWGRGVVRQVWPITHDGEPAQRLAVDFDHRGRVMLNSAVAPLAPQGESTTIMNSTATTSRFASSSSGRGWLDELERNVGRSNGHALWELPEQMTDPFASLSQRLRATLDSYRFSTEPRALIDWATAQTGLHDPLTQYNRTELEQAFSGFARNRDQHLRSLVIEMKRKGQTPLLQQALQQTRQPEARQALQKAIRA